jgi:uncharacterized OsmC-like protein
MKVNIYILIHPYRIGEVLIGKSGKIKIEQYNLDQERRMTDLTTNQGKGKRDIVVTARATSIEKWRKQVVAGQPETKASFAFISDEGSYIPGGEGTAPSPLTYFVSGIALCLISHITQVANKKKLTIRSEKAEVTAHFHEEGSVLRGDAEGYCDRFEINISLDSDEDLNEIKQLIRLAHRLCFAEKAVAGTVPIRISQQVNGKTIKNEY